MLKANKKFFIVTCIITVLPILVGLLLWNQLPDRVATHFGTDGTPNGYSSKLVAVIGIYLFCLAVHVFCALVTSVDPKGKNISPKVYRLILCICPLVSIYAGATVYGNALDYKGVNSTVWINALMAVILIVVGNYLPKCRQNYTIGIKLPWTLAYAPDGWQMVDTWWCANLSGWLSVMGRSGLCESDDYYNRGTDSRSGIVSVFQKTQLINKIRRNNICILSTGAILYIVCQNNR